MRLVFRLFGLLFLAGAFVAAVVDGARSLAAGEATLTPMGAAIAWAAPHALPRLQAFLETRLSPLLWDPALVGVLTVPAFVDLALIGALVFFLGRRPAPKIGHSSRDR